MGRKLTTVFFIALVLIGVGIQRLSLAGEQGHYFPGVMNIRDGIIPPAPGVYLAPYDFYYESDTFKDAEGDEIGPFSVSGTLTKPLSLGHHTVNATFTGTVSGQLDVEFETVAHQIFVLWNTGHKLLGADYALAIGPSFGYMHVKAEADVNGTGTVAIGPASQTVSGSRHIEVEDDTYGLGDLFVMPVMLGWTGEFYDFAVNYGFYAPVGEFDQDNLVNMGFGFWTHQWQGTLIYYPTLIAPKATGLMFRTTYELHGDQEGADITPGQNIAIEYGISQYLSPQLEIGAFGHHTWQITDDDGADAVNEDVHDSTSAWGVHVGYWPIEKKFYVAGRFFWEYGSEDRFEGWTAALNGVYAF